MGGERLSHRSAAVMTSPSVKSSFRFVILSKYCMQRTYGSLSPRNEPPVMEKMILYLLLVLYIESGLFLFHATRFNLNSV